MSAPGLEDDAPLLGADQNPLRQGVFRAVAVARRAPGRRVVYAVQDADALGRKGTAYGLEAHRGKYFSVTFDHPGTPRVPGIAARLSELFGSRKLPPARLEITGPGLPIIGRARVDEVILKGLRSEIEWAVRCGAPEARARTLEAFISSLSGEPLPSAFRAIAEHVLAAAGLAWPGNLVFTTVTELLKTGSPKIASLPHFEPTWLWTEDERPGAGQIPRGELLPLELALRGYRLYATRLPYWDRVAEHARAAGLPLAPPVEVRAPNLRLLEQDPLAFFDAEDTLRIRDLRDLRERWSEAWSARPTLLWAHLHGHVKDTIDRATIAGLGR